MKTTLAFLLLLISSLAMADICTLTIRDQYGYEYDSFTRSSYSPTAACDEASWDCRQKLSEYQAYGQHYNSVCVVTKVISSYPIPPSYPPTYPPTYPPRYPDYPREPRYPREPNYPRPRDPREPPRHEPGSEPRRPGPAPRPRPRILNVLEIEN